MHYFYECIVPRVQSAPNALNAAKSAWSGLASSRKLTAIQLPTRSCEQSTQTPAVYASALPGLRLLTLSAFTAGPPWYHDAAFVHMYSTSTHAPNDHPPSQQARPPDPVCSITQAHMHNTDMEL